MRRSRRRHDWLLRRLLPVGRAQKGAFPPLSCRKLLRNRVLVPTPVPIGTGALLDRIPQRPAFIVPEAERAAIGLYLRDQDHLFAVDDGAHTLDRHLVALGET